MTIGALAPQIITFGNGVGQVGTLAQLNVALQGLAGVGPTSSVDAQGNIKIVAANTSDVITVTGGPVATPLNLPTFGITNAQGFPSNGNVYGVDQSNFLAESVAGGSITAYDGTPTAYGSGVRDHLAALWQAKPATNVMTPLDAYAPLLVLSAGVVLLIVVSVVTSIFTLRRLRRRKRAQGVTGM